MDTDVSNANIDAWIESRWAAVFMNLASREVSKPYTTLREIEGFENEEFKEINDALQKFIEKTRFAKEVTE